MTEITYVATFEPAMYPVVMGYNVECRRVQAFDGDKLIGSLFMDLTGLHVLLEVHPAYHRQGVATGMFYKAKEAGFKPRRGARNILPWAAAWADTLDWS